MSRLCFESVLLQDSNEPLADLQEYPFVLDPAYFRNGWSPSPLMRLRREVADALARIQASWRGRYRFKIWDGHRPRAVQQAIYDSYARRLAQAHPEWDRARLDDETQRFVTRASTAERVPPHATGGAVDLTLVAADGGELDMGTAFDYFGPEASPAYYETARRSTMVRDNRRLLSDAMLTAGFTGDDSEWWHFDLGNQSWALRSGRAVARFGEVGAVSPVPAGGLMDGATR